MGFCLFLSVFKLTSAARMSNFPSARLDSLSHIHAHMDTRSHTHTHDGSALPRLAHSSLYPSSPPLPSSPRDALSLSLSLFFSRSRLLLMINGAARSLIKAEPLAG